MDFEDSLGGYRSGGRQNKKALYVQQAKYAILIILVPNVEIIKHRISECIDKLYRLYNLLSLIFLVNSSAND